MSTRPSKQHKILLIKPRQQFYHYTMQPELLRFMGKKSQMPSYAFALLSVMTPSRFSLKIVDELVEDIPLDYQADIVGFSTIVATINRTYALADHFKNRGATVVMGGPYATYRVEEALTHAHTVIKGEAEGLWQLFLKDFENGSPQKIYEQTAPLPFASNYIPRWDNIPINNYLTLPVQASRGCPFGCDFCLTSKMFGTRMRLRTVDNIIEEIASLPLKRLFFVDDNLTINKPFARELMERLKPLNVSWICQSSIEIADDAGLLHMMAEAGCDNILIGFESLNRNSLAEARKFQNINVDYVSAINRIHKAGIHVYASMVIGFDHDTVDELDRIHEFTLEAGVPIVNLNILNDAPGTDLYRRMAEEKRHIDLPPEYHGGLYPFLDYKRMTLTGLLDRYMDISLKMYSYDIILAKAKKLFSAGSFNRRKHDDDIAVREKFTLTVGLLRRHLFTRDRNKRAFFFFMMGLVGRKKIVMERAIIFLISMEGFNKYVVDWYPQKARHLAFFREIEKKKGIA